jgi:hypothetical protein
MPSFGCDSCKGNKVFHSILFYRIVFFSKKSCISDNMNYFSEIYASKTLGIAGTHEEKSLCLYNSMQDAFGLSSVVILHLDYPYLHSKLLHLSVGKICREMGLIYKKRVYVIAYSEIIRDYYDAVINSALDEFNIKMGKGEKGQVKGNYYCDGDNWHLLPY